MNVRPRTLGILESIQDLNVHSLLVFEAENLASVCTALGKRHFGQEHTLSLARPNYLEPLNDSARFVP